MDTLELTIDIVPKDPWSDIVIAELSELGFDSFVTTDSGILAYGSPALNVETILAQTVIENEKSIEVSVKSQVIPHQNWNATWEENFQPVYIENYASIIAPFHDRSSAKGLVVEIQPQMSFGTGHHQTTWMMTKALFELSEMPEKVLDMGTGTGVLAIVAEKLGAKDILAIDIEEWSAENAAENARRNDCATIRCLCGDIDKVDGETFGLIIANINKNILKAHMRQYAEALEAGGTLLLSGFFISDVDEMEQFAAAHKLKKTKTFERDEWAAIQLVKD